MASTHEYAVCSWRDGEMDDIDVRDVRSSLDVHPTPATAPAPTPTSVPPFARPPSKASRYDTEHKVSSRSSGSMKWEKTWKVPAGIVGFYVLALAIAIVHFGFFNYLDGRFFTDDVEVSEKSTSIPQNYVTTISFLLVTVFRAALVASVGICYTQHLWAILRKQTLKVSLIESLFQIRTSASYFSNYHLAFKAPTLALVAAFCWLVPLATVFPPGALIVEPGSLDVDTRFNVSVFHRKNLTDNSSSIAQFSYLPASSDYVHTHNLPADYKDAKDSFHGFYTNIPNSTELKYIARSVFMSGEVVNLDRPSGLNSTYSLEFWGTAIDCKTANRTRYRALDTRDYYHAAHKDMMGITDAFPVYNLTYINELTNHRVYLANRTIYYEESSRRNQVPDRAEEKPKIQYYPCYDLEGSGSQYLQNPKENSFYAPEINIIEPMVTTNCIPKIVRYYVNITHAGGNQSISYQVRNERPDLEYSLQFSEFDGDLEHWSQFSDAFTMYDGFGSMLSVSSSLFSLVNVSRIVAPLGPYELPNGTVVETCDLEIADEILTSGFAIGYAYHRQKLETGLWESSIFGRKNPTDSNYGIGFDPALLNDVLAKTTISALSLNTRYAMVDGTETLALNIYWFQRKLLFFLPYALSLGLALPIIALGLFALYIENNGVSAISGGFIQILMTTTGRTSLEAVIAKGSRSMGGHENVSKELSDMEIRFGQLIEEDGEASREATPTNPHGQVRNDNAEIYDVTAEEASQDGSGYTMVETMADVREEGATVRRRAGFGTLEETRPFSKGT